LARGLTQSFLTHLRQGDQPPGAIVLRPWHRLAAEIGPSTSTFDDGDVRFRAMLGLGALIRANARYHGAGAGSTTAWPGQWSSARARVLVAGGAVRGTTFDADALVIGRYVRRAAAARSRCAPGSAPPTPSRR
jgi:hypothetical protein